ncbi:MAG: hypothetical protein V4608_14890 [Bacteroidota bacterium]
MIKTTTIRIDDRIQSTAVSHSKEKLIRGGFSAYVEMLVINDLKKAGKMPEIKKEIKNVGI